MKLAHLFPILVAMTGASLFGDVSVQLTAPAKSVRVGRTLTFTAVAKDSTNNHTSFVYQFTARRSGSTGPFTAIQDFYFENTFSWTPSDHEGWFDIGVLAWSQASHATGSGSIKVYVAPVVAGSTPVISNTKNPLVALYSAPSCSAPGRVRVSFWKSWSNSKPAYTPFQNCNGSSINFYIAGMTASSTYTIRQLMYSGSNEVAGPQLTYTTGSIPSNVRVSKYSKLAGPQAPTSILYPYLVYASLSARPVATDLDGNIVWYLASSVAGDSGYMAHLASGGTSLVIQDDLSNFKKICPANTVGACGDHQFLREFDLAGNVVRQTDWTLLNDEINALRSRQGKHPLLLNFISHEAQRLPNGYLVTMVTNEQVKNIGGTPTDVFGDAIVVLDPNWQVAWVWDAFDYLDVNRETLPAVCKQGSLGCPAQFRQFQSKGQLFKQANDWTHGNAVSYDPSDGNLLISFRNQSWIIKVAYGNGSGDGHLVWKLGYGGDFQLAAGHPVSDWFSGQHDPVFQSDGLMSVFDNRNPSPLTQQPGGTARGQSWKLDVHRKIATPVVNVDLGVISAAVGSATMLCNGNYEFGAGFINRAAETQTSELTPSGDLAFRAKSTSGSYRTFRVRDLYTP